MEVTENSPLTIQETPHRFRLSPSGDWALSLQTLKLEADWQEGLREVPRVLSTVCGGNRGDGGGYLGGGLASPVLFENKAPAVCSAFSKGPHACCGLGCSWHRGLSADLQLGHTAGKSTSSWNLFMETFWAPSECRPVLGPGEARCARQVLLDFKRGLTVQSVVLSWIYLFMALLFLCCCTQVSLTEARRDYSLLHYSLLWCIRVFVASLVACGL